MIEQSTKTLKSILSIIKKDVRKIKQRTGDGPLEPEVALTLTRYANTLSSIVEESEETRTRAKKHYEKMSTEELIKLFQAEQKANAKKEKSK